MSDLKTHKRINDIFLAPLERPALKWLAAHMPAWMNPDILTGIGVFGSVVIFAGYGLSYLDRNYLWLATLGFVINWFGDSLDGTLARYRHIERPIYGFFIDHTLDAFSEVLVFLGIGLSPYVRFEYACLALVGYLLISVLAYIRTACEGKFQISYAGLGPTEARLIAISANTLIYFVGNPQVQLYKFTNTVYDWIVLGVIVLLFSIFVVSTIKQGRILAKTEE